MSGSGPPKDVPSPIEFRDMSEAREWEASAEQRPGRSEILDRIAQEAAQITRSGDRILELGSGPRLPRPASAPATSRR